MKRTLQASGFVALAWLGTTFGVAEAAPVARLRLSLHGNATVIGNTLAHDCAGGTPTPVVGTLGSCGSNLVDTAPDVFWRSDSPTAGLAEANSGITSATARSSAVLTLPSGAVVIGAYLYWAGTRSAGPDTAITFDGPNGSTHAVNSTQTFVANGAYQAVGNVTSFVFAQGAGTYRVSDVDIDSFNNVDDNALFAGWWLTVLYKREADPVRFLGIYDGLDFMSTNIGFDLNVTGLRVPNGATSARLWGIAFDGDPGSSGDELWVNTTRLSNALNPGLDWVNGTHSSLGLPVSQAGDLPQLAGGVGSMSGMDLDEYDLLTATPAGSTSLIMKIGSNISDNYWLGGIVTAVESSAPSMGASGITFTDTNGGALKVGDVIDVTMTLTNTGTDDATLVSFNQDLPAGVDFVPGSIEVLTGANAGVKTDAAGDDVAEYQSSLRRVRVNIGLTATSSAGGNLPTNATSQVRFKATITGGAGQRRVTDGSLVYSGALGAPPTTLPFGVSIPIDECATDPDCSGLTPACDVTPNPNVCVGCLADAHCKNGLFPTCNATSKTCGCVASGAEVCDGKDNNCTGGIDEGGNALCAGNVSGPSCRTFNTVTACGCATDSDCGNATSGKVCSDATKTCIDGCAATPRNGCPSGQFCTSSTATIGSCTTTCTNDAQCIAQNPAKPACLVVDGGVSVCVECALDIQCAARTDGRTICAGANNTCSQCSATRKENCDATKSGAACLTSGLCGCTGPTDCAPGRQCNMQKSLCEPSAPVDAGTDGAVDAGKDATTAFDGSPDAAMAQDATVNSLDGDTDASIDKLGGGGMSCAAGNAPSGSIGLTFGLSALTLAMMRRRSRRAERTTR